MIAQVEAGESDYELVEIEQRASSGDVVVVRVMADMLKLGGVRINVSARLQQQLADLLSCRLMTARISDLCWLAKTLKLVPHTRNNCPTSTAAMKETSAEIDRDIDKLGGRPPGAIVCTGGKDWILDNDFERHPGKGVNYGWHLTGTLWSASATLPGVRVIQPPSTFHDFSHDDYSQRCRLVSRQALLNGEPIDLDLLLTHPTLSKLLSHQGPMKFLRQPGITELEPLPLITFRGEVARVVL
jgi:hypothetical protein